MRKIKSGLQTKEFSQKPHKRTTKNQLSLTNIWHIWSINRLGHFLYCSLLSGLCTMIQELAGSSVIKQVCVMFHLWQVTHYNVRFNQSILKYTKVRSSLKWYFFLSASIMTYEKNMTAKINNTFHSHEGFIIISSLFPEESTKSLLPTARWERIVLICNNGV